MTTEPDSIVFQHLRAIRTQLDSLNDRVLKLATHLQFSGSAGEHFSPHRSH